MFPKDCDPCKASDIYAILNNRVLDKSKNKINKSKFDVNLRTNFVC